MEQENQQIFTDPPRQASLDSLYIIRTRPHSYLAVIKIKRTSCSIVPRHLFPDLGGKGGGGANTRVSEARTRARTVDKSTISQRRPVWRPQCLVVAALRVMELPLISLALARPELVAGTKDA